MDDDWWVTPSVWIFIAITWVMILGGPVLAFYYSNGEWLWMSLPIIFYLS